ncbi:TetR/AcrR family transcriptional regulator [Silvimonas iriomotensis]|uniref:TetR family transcriptional regulator n=1 Tax=Silvimonas iriomotensis TaxID=449662 RepID=A0ABQ2P3Z8_9NEIS|nr:TetR/AcrR family transcriptional regulator [Silvimonas iriomotensis]GGP17666.1 TetR family transcriptional regulator [Silvimonas iriomotensis]
MKTETIDPATLPARERILRVAHDLFYRDGIRATGIDRVIAEAGVTKVTFYRHYPGKNELIRAFLQDRHERWMNWFTAALQRHGGSGLAVLVPVLAEWFGSDQYRGCAFINAVAEQGGGFADAAQIARAHKADMTAAIATLLPASSGRERVALAAAVAVDGAMVRAQTDGSPQAALDALTLLLAVLPA